MTIINISRDELKSSINDNLLAASKELINEIDTYFTNAWSAPLRLMQNAVDNPELNTEEKLAVLQSGIQTIPDLLYLQLLVKGLSPALLLKKDFKQQLDKAEIKLSGMTIVFNRFYF